MKKWEKNIFLLIIPLVVIPLVIFYLKPQQPDFLSLAKKFLDTKTTDINGLNLVCGPPDDWDCGYTRYQFFAIDANTKYYEVTGDSKYLDYAINFANTRPTSPPPYCSTCICSMPDDVDCGNGEDQEGIGRSFATLYRLTGNKTFLDFAEKVANAKPTSPPDWCNDCVCGPPDDWDCGPGSFHIGYYNFYNQLYNLTNNMTYKTYMQNLADSYLDTSPQDRGIKAITFFLVVFNKTGDSKYLEIAKEKALNLSSSNYFCGPPDKWQCPERHRFHQARTISLYTSLYEATRDNEFLDRAIKFANAGGVDCGPLSDWVCEDPWLQADMARAYYKMYKITGNEKYLEYFNNLISEDSLEKLNCKNFDCHDAEFNYFFTLVFIELGSSQGIIKENVESFESEK